MREFKFVAGKSKVAAHSFSFPSIIEMSEWSFNEILLNTRLVSGKVNRRYFRKEFCGCVSLVDDEVEYLKRNTDILLVEFI